jgi:ATP-dependent Zn protease
MDELVESIERVMAGPARRSRVLNERDRQIIAFHEAGHAIVMEALHHADKVGKITIVSRGQSLGYVMPLPEDDRTLRSRAEYEDTITSLLSGRVAEELTFAEPSTGAVSDLERVTKLAKAMVARFGMSEFYSFSRVIAIRLWVWKSVNSATTAKTWHARLIKRCAGLSRQHISVHAISCWPKKTNCC